MKTFKFWYNRIRGYVLGPWFDVVAYKKLKDGKVIKIVMVPPDERQGN